MSIIPRDSLTALALAAAALVPVPCLAAPPSPPAAAPGLRWEVLGRFRLLTDRRQHDRFLAGAFAGGARYDAVGDLLGVPPGDAAEGRGFRLATGWDQDAATADAAWFHDPLRPARYRPNAAALAALAAANGGRVPARCRFAIGAAAPAEGPCDGWRTARLPLGATTIAWGPAPPASSPPAAAPLEWSASLTLRDVKVAVLGDSFASGEGNPVARAVRPTEDRGLPAAWLDERCHLSPIGAPLLAAARLALDDPHASVTAVSFACSGGAMREGLLAPYAGRETPAQVVGKHADVGDSLPTHYYHPALIPPQVDRLAALLCRPGAAACAERAALDALVVGTGGNELGFGNLVRAILGGAAERGAPAVRARAAREIGLLRGDFARLATALRPLAPPATLLVSYLDPTRDEDGAWCGRRAGRNVLGGIWGLIGVGGISQAEAELAAGAVLGPLEALHKEVAARDGWRFVGDFDRRHGVCARPTWFRQYWESTALQGQVVMPSGESIPTGLMHPNAYGHLHVAGHLHRALRAALGPPGP